MCSTHRERENKILAKISELSLVTVDLPCGILWAVWVCAAIVPVFHFIRFTSFQKKKKKKKKKKKRKKVVKCISYRYFSSVTQRRQLSDPFSINSLCQSVSGSKTE